MKLKYDVGDKPLWAQLFDILLDRIVSKEYNAGDKMPTDLEIMQEFDVSRMTVRQAMNKLINEGYIERRRGKGTIVLEKENKVETILKSSFNGVLEKNDIKNRRVLNVEMVNAGQEIADFFNITTKDKVLRLVREIRINNMVVSIHETFLNPIVPLDEQGDYSGSLYEKLLGAGYGISNVKEKISASLMNQKQKELFEIKGDEAMINRQRRGFCHDFPVEFTNSMYLSQGYELIIDLCE